MNGLLFIGSLSIASISVIALLASIGDRKIARFTRDLPRSFPRRRALTVIVYHTTIQGTLATIAALHALGHPHLAIIVVDNATLGKHAHAFRTGLSRLYHRPIRLFIRRLPTTRRRAILAATRHISPRQPVLLIDGGDLVSEDLISTIPSAATLRRVKHTLWWPHSAPLGPSFNETTNTLTYCGIRLFARARKAVIPTTNRTLPAGTIYANTRALRRVEPLEQLESTLLTTTSPLPQSAIGLATLLVLSLSVLAVFGHAAYLAASLQTTQPLLLFALVSLFASAVLILWDQTTGLIHKAHLLLVAPLSGLLLPVSIFVLAGASLLHKASWLTLRPWKQLTWTGRKHS